MPPALQPSLAKKDYRIVPGGTDTHQVLVDLTPIRLRGSVAEETLEFVGIILNKNVIPSDAAFPGRASDVRLGSGAISARGMGDSGTLRIADFIHAALLHHDRRDVLAAVLKEVFELCVEFPVYG